MKSLIVLGIPSRHSDVEEAFFALSGDVVQQGRGRAERGAAFLT